MYEFRCRDLEMQIFEFKVETISEAIDHLQEYEERNNTLVQCYEKSTGRRIVGGELEYLNVRLHPKMEEPKKETPKKGPIISFKIKI